jgi:hypothetical protein
MKKMSLDNDNFIEIIDEYFRLHPITDEERSDGDLFRPIESSLPPHHSPSKKRKRDDEVNDIYRTVSSYVHPLHHLLIHILLSLQYPLNELEYFSAIEFTVKYHDWKDSVDPMIRTFMRQFIQNHITEAVKDHKLTVKCDLVAKVKKIEEIILSQLSLNIQDFYEPTSLVDRMQMGIRAACIDRSVTRQLNKVCTEYEISQAQYEKLYYLHKIRSLIIILAENKLRQNDHRCYQKYKRDFLNLTDSICQIFTEIRSKT